jgi:hypothetical protein
VFVGESDAQWGQESQKTNKKSGESGGGKKKEETKNVVASEETKEQKRIKIERVDLLTVQVHSRSTLQFRSTNEKGKYGRDKVEKRRKRRSRRP